MNINDEFSICTHIHRCEKFSAESTTLMATSAELTRESDKELLLLRVNELVFVDALAGFECRRCERTLIRHYVAHCGHYFCHNCKQLLLRSKSNCPLPACKQPLMDMDVQNVEFERKLYELRAHCPNKKYGCKFVSQLKDLGGHLRVCKDTREGALPVEINGPGVLEAVLRELSIKFDKLSADVNKIKEDTSRIEVKVDNNIEGMERKMAEMIKNFDGKSSETVNNLKDIKVEIERKIKNLETKVGNNHNLEEMKAALDKAILDLKAEVWKKMTETTNKFDGKSSETVNSLKDIKVEMDRKITEVTRKLDEKVSKTEVEVKFRNIKAEIEMSKVNTQKGDLNEINKKLDMITKETNDKYSKMTQQLTLEIAKIDTKIKENKTFTEGKVKDLIPPLSRKLDDKVLELNTKITKLTNTTEENKSLIKSNKSTEINNLEQKFFNLERLTFLKSPQIDNYSLSEGKCHLMPNFSWTINGLASRVKQSTFEMTSGEFEWTGYSIRARAKLEVKRDDSAYMSLILRENNNGKAIDIKSIPSIYFVLRDRSGNRDTKHRSRSMTYLFTATFSNSLTFDTTLVHKSWLTNSVYDVDDSVVVEVYVEPPSMAQQVLSNDGIFNWAIHDFWKRKQMAKDGLACSQNSPYFYTAPKGYRVQMRMWLNGWGEYAGKGLTAEIDFLTGEFDADLPLTSTYCTTITFFNPNHTQHNIIKTIDQDIQLKKDFFIDMGVHEAIKNVILNDTLFYKVSITPSN